MMLERLSETVRGAVATEFFDGRVLKPLTVLVTASLTFRPARNADAAELSAIAWAAKAHWGYPEAWLEEWRKHLTITAKTLLAEQVWVAESTGSAETRAIVGFYSLRKDRLGWHLEHLWVKPARIGQGIGRALVEHAKREARSVAVQELRITSDPSAEAFYLKMGAVRTGVERYHLFGTILRELPLMVLKT